MTTGTVTPPIQAFGTALGRIAMRIPEPQTIEETGLQPQVIADLLAKTMY